MKRDRAENDDVPSLLQVATLVLWLACLFVGALGWVLTSPRRAPAPPPPVPPPPVQAELINVEVAKEPPPIADAAPPPAQPPDAAPDVPPPLPAVAAPTALVAFAVPVEGPARIVDARFAGHGRPGSGQRAQRITYGVGLGRQPAPEYPREAVVAGEQGLVIVRFRVAPDGHIVSAMAIAPSRWPLLNQAAVNTVREAWHLPPGLYDVPITFHLNES